MYVVQASGTAGGARAAKMISAKSTGRTIPIQQSSTTLMVTLTVCICLSVCQSQWTASAVQEVAPLPADHPLPTEMWRRYEHQHIDVLPLPRFNWCWSNPAGGSGPDPTQVSWFCSWTPFPPNAEAQQCKVKGWIHGKSQTHTRRGKGSTILNFYTISWAQNW